MTKMIITIIALFLSQSGFANQCLQEASYDDLVQELKERDLNLIYEPDDLRIAFTCGVENLEISVVNLTKQRHRKVAVPNIYMQITKCRERVTYLENFIKDKDLAGKSFAICTLSKEGIMMNKLFLSNKEVIELVGQHRFNSFERCKNSASRYTERFFN